MGRGGAGLSLVAKLALQRGMSSLSGGPFGRMGPIRSFDKFAVLANRPLKMPGGLFTGRTASVSAYVPLSLLMLGNGVKRFTAPH